MVDRFLVGTPLGDGFGLLLEPDMLEAYLASQRLARDSYRKAHPEIVQLVREAADEVGVVLVDELDR